MSIYREIILDHYSNPRNAGKIEKPDAEATQDNPLCGDRITIQLVVKKGKSPTSNSAVRAAPSVKLRLRC